MKITNFKDISFYSYYHSGENVDKYLSSISTNKSTYPYLLEVLGNWEECDELEIYMVNYLGFSSLNNDEGYIGIYTGNPCYIDYYAYILTHNYYWRTESYLMKKYEELNLNYFDSEFLRDKLEKQFSFSYDGSWRVMSALKTSYDYGYITYGFKEQKQLDLAISILIASELLN